MPRGLIVCLWFWVYKEFQNGQTASIQTQENMWVAAGGDADLSCLLLEGEEVHQVTWMKKSRDKVEHVCSCEESRCEVENSDFKDKVQCKNAGLKIISMVIRKVTEQDQGCYSCSFRLSPPDVQTAGTCLYVYELHEPILHIRDSSSPEESGVSCSATGRPAPTVTLTVTQQHLSFSQHNTTRVHNNNNTVTVTTTAVLSGLHDDSTQVGCVVGVASGAQIQVFQRKQTCDEGLEQQSESDQGRIRGWLVLGPVILVACLCALASFVWYRKLTQNRQPDMTENPSTLPRDPQRSQEQIWGPQRRRRSENELLLEQKEKLTSHHHHHHQQQQLRTE